MSFFRTFSLIEGALETRQSALVRCVFLLCKYLEIPNLALIVPDPLTKQVNKSPGKTTMSTATRRSHALGQQSQHERHQQKPRTTKNLVRTPLILLICVGVPPFLVSVYDRLVRNVLILKQQPQNAAQRRTGVDTVQPLLQRTPNPKLTELEAMPQSLLEALTAIEKQRGLGSETNSTGSNNPHDQRATFIQIGANDGEMFDPLYEFWMKQEDRRRQWIGLLVEPQSDLFQKLPLLHPASAAPGWSFYNGAIVESASGGHEEGQQEEFSHCRDNVVKFCETKTPGIGDWRTQGQLNSVGGQECRRNSTQMHWVSRNCVSSFPELLLHANDELRQRIATSTGSSALDLLQIDVEGHDYAILKLLLSTPPPSLLGDNKDRNDNSFALRPLCVHYESFHLHGDEENAANFLRSLGYTVHKTGAMDTLACLVKEKATGIV